MKMDINKLRKMIYAADQICIRDLKSIREKHFADVSPDEFYYRVLNSINTDVLSMCDGDYVDADSMPRGKKPIKGEGYLYSPEMPE